MSLLLAAVVATAQPQASHCPDLATHVSQQAYTPSGGDRWATVKSLQFRYTSGLERLDDVVAGRFEEHHGFRADGFDGVSSWWLGKSGIAYVLGDRDAQLQAAKDSYRTERAWLFAARHPATIAYAGKRVDHGTPFDTIQITPEGGRPFTLWVDVACTPSHATSSVARRNSTRRRSLTTVWSMAFAFQSPCRATMAMPITLQT